MEGNRKCGSRAMHLLGVAVAGGLLGTPLTPVRAQEAEPARGPVLEEIIVTAQRREERIQNVPIAITAFDANALRQANIADAHDLTARVPGLTVSSGGMMRSADIIAIRGQGQGILSPVGVVNYFAEVPLIQGNAVPAQGGPGTFFDLENMQILRGPQGTLFGRNTTGGAVLLGPKKPADTFEGYLQVQGGNYDDREIEGAVSIPLVRDTLLVRLSYKDVERDGYTEDVGPAPFGYTDLCQPMSAVLCGAFSPPGTRSPGFAGTEYDDKDYWHARIGVLWRPTEAIENYLLAYSAESSDNGTGFRFDGAGAGMNVANLTGNMAYAPSNVYLPGRNMFDPTVTQAILAVQNGLGKRKTAMNVDQFTDIEADAVIDTLSIELGENLRFRNIASYQTMVMNYNWDLDGSILPMLSQQPPQNFDPRNPFADVGERGDITNYTQYTEEAQLLGSLLDGRFEYVAGVFHAKTEPDGYNATGSFNAATLAPGGGAEIENTSTAFYAQGTLHLGALSDALEQFRLTAGIRRTEDETEGARFTTYYSDRVYYGPGKNDYDLPARRANLHSDEPTWTVGLDYEASDDMLLYGKVSRGYKAGAFNPIAPRRLTAEPEFVTSFELGAKTDFLIGDMPARVNASLFYLDYEDIQRSAADNFGIGTFQPEEYDRNEDGDTNDYVCVGPNGENYSASSTCVDQGAIMFNADSATIKGLELEATLRPTENLDLMLAYSYMDGQYDDFTLEQWPDPLRGGTTMNTCNGPVTVPYLGQAPVEVDLSCIPIQYLPENIASLTARYSLPLAEELGELVLVGNVNYRDEQYSSATTHPDDDPLAMVESFHVYNVSAEWNGVMGSGFDLRAFVNNVADDTYRLMAYVGMQQASGFVNSIYGEPRMYGLSLRYRFGAER